MIFKQRACKEDEKHVDSFSDRHCIIKKYMWSNTRNRIAKEEEKKRGTVNTI